MNYPTAPDIDPNDKNYAHCRVEEILPVKAEAFFDWYMKEPIKNFMRGTLIVSPVTGEKALPNQTYGVIGHSRFIEFKDRTSAYERVLSTDFPRAYSYQPYAFTNPVRLISDHAKATMTAVPEGDHTRIIWDYAFHARHWMFLPLLRGFVSLDWKRYLKNGLNVIKAHLAVHGVDKRIDEVDAPKRT
jgi:hypothetical protein